MFRIGQFCLNCMFLRAYRTALQSNLICSSVVYNKRARIVIIYGTTLKTNLIRLSYGYNMCEKIFSLDK